MERERERYSEGEKDKEEDGEGDGEMEKKRVTLCLILNLNMLTWAKNGVTNAPIRAADVITPIAIPRTLVGNTSGVYT